MCSTLPWSFLDQSLQLKGKFWGKLNFPVLSLNTAHPNIGVKLKNPE